MAKRGRHQKKGGRTTPKGTRPLGSGRSGGPPGPRLPPAAAPWPPPPDLDPPDDDSIRDSLATALHQGPAPFLEAAATIWQMFQPDPSEGGRRMGRPRVPTFDEADDHDLVDIGIANFVGAFLEPGDPVSHALALVLAAIEPDPGERRRIQRVVPTGRPPLPPWVDHLDELRVTEAFALVHVYDDSDNVVLGVEIADEHFSIVTFVDHNIGTVLKDAYLSDLAVGEMRELMATRGAPENMRVIELPPPDAAARLREGLEGLDIDDHLIDIVTTDTWPACRPVVERVLRSLPLDGTGYPRGSWSIDDAEVLADEVLASPYGTEFDPEIALDPLIEIIGHGAGAALGDPLRWSPVQIEILLAIVGPKVAYGTREGLALVPDLLRALILFGHAATEVPDAETRSSLEAVDHWAPSWAEAMPRMLFTDDDHLSRRDIDALIRANAADRLDELARAVGGPDVLDALDELAASPLPDETLETAGLPDDIVERVRGVGKTVDELCERLYDVEFRTACRRLTRRLATVAPDLFRTRGRDDYAAGAIVWIAARANGGHHIAYGDVLGKELAAALSTGLGTLNGRGNPMLEALDAPSEFGLVRLGDADLLTSQARRELAERRDELRTIQRRHSE